MELATLGSKLGGGGPRASRERRAAPPTAPAATPHPPTPACPICVTVSGLLEDAAPQMLVLGSQGSPRGRAGSKVLFILYLRKSSGRPCLHSCLEDQNLNLVTAQSRCFRKE